MKKLIIPIVFAASLASANAGPIMQEFGIFGNQSSPVARFWVTYDDAAPIISINNNNVLGVDDLWVTTAAYGTEYFVIDGAVQAPSLRLYFSFNPQTLAVSIDRTQASLIGYTVQGGPFPGFPIGTEIGYKYTLNQSADMLGFGQLRAIPRVPDSGTTAALMLGGICGLGWLRRKFHRR